MSTPLVVSSSCLNPDSGYYPSRQWKLGEQSCKRVLRGSIVVPGLGLQGVPGLSQEVLQGLGRERNGDYPWLLAPRLFRCCPGF